MTPVLNFPAELLLRAQDIKVLFLDVDGVLTDGGLYMNGDGELIKRFNSLDGHGLKLLRRAGVEVAVITGRDSPALRCRLAEVGVTHAFYKIDNKLEKAELVLKTLGLNWGQAAAMGDDWPDLPMMQRSALSAAPANAHVEVRALAHYVTPMAGGDGAVRQVCDLLLTACGCYAGLLAECVA